MGEGGDSVPGSDSAPGIVHRIRRARDAGELSELVSAIPYCRFLGLSIEREGESYVGTLRYDDQLIGNPHVPALHGGVVGALLENTAALQLILTTDTERLPRIVNLTVDYLRGAGPGDTFAQGEVFRLGRRIAVVRAVAWQDDRNRPVASANVHFLM